MCMYIYMIYPEDLKLPVMPIYVTLPVTSKYVGVLYRHFQHEKGNWFPQAHKIFWTDWTSYNLEKTFHRSK